MKHKSFKKPSGQKPKRKRHLDAEEKAFVAEKKKQKMVLRETAAEEIAAKQSTRVMEKEKRQISREEVLRAIAEGREKERERERAESSFSTLMGLLGQARVDDEDEEEEDEEQEDDKDQDEEDEEGEEEGEEEAYENDDAVEEDQDDDDDDGDDDDEQSENEATLEEEEATDDPDGSDSDSDDSVCEPDSQISSSYDFDLPLTDAAPKFSPERCVIGPFDRCLRNSPRQISEADLRGHKDLGLPQAFRSSPIALAALSAFSSYSDVSIAEDTVDGLKGIRDAAAFHAFNHILTARDIVMRNTARLQADPTLDIRDQGFTRPKVLVLAATRNCAWKFLCAFLNFSDGKRAGNVLGLSKVKSKFCQDDSDDSANARSEFFAGNTDDNFTLGVSVTKRSIKVGCNYYVSDLLICSPLGLRLAINPDDEDKKAENGDFLSSLEVVIVDRTDYLKFQNLEHVQTVLELSNKQPLSLRGVDISRLRLSTVEEKSRMLRQTIAYGSTIDSEMLGLFEDRWLPVKQRKGVNIRGFVRMGKTLPGAAVQAAKSMGVHRQMFLCAGTLDSVLDAFRDKFWKPVGSDLTRLVVCCSSYNQFLFLRNWFRKNTEAAVAPISEFTEQRKLNARREEFSVGEKSVLLITERLLWYKPLKLKGIQHVVFFGSPAWPDHYMHLVSRVGDPSKANVLTIFEPVEALAVERLVGSEAMGRVLPAINAEGQVPSKMTVF